MGFFRDCLVLLAVGTVLPSDSVCVHGAQDNTKEQKEVQQLVDQLGSTDFATREKAARKLLDLGETALPALQKAMRSPDAEVRRRSEQLIAEIKAKGEERALQQLLADLNQTGLDKFIDRMVKDKEFATDERWATVMKLAQAMAARASEVGGKGFVAPRLDIANLKTVREGFGEDCSEVKVLVDGVRDMGSLERSILLSSGPVRELTALRDSIVIVSGDIGECTYIKNCIVLCRGNIARVTGIDDSIVLATGRLDGATGIKRSLLQVKGVGQTTSSRDTVYLNLTTSPAYQSRDDRFIQTERGPLQMFRFGAPARRSPPSQQPAPRPN